MEWGDGGAWLAPIFCVWCLVLWLPLPTRRLDYDWKFQLQTSAPQCPSNTQWPYDLDNQQVMWGSAWSLYLAQARVVP